MDISIHEDAGHPGYTARIVVHDGWSKCEYTGPPIKFTRGVMWFELGPLRFKGGMWLRLHRGLTRTYGFSIESGVVLTTYLTSRKWRQRDENSTGNL